MKDPNPYMIDSLLSDDPFQEIFNNTRNIIFFEYSSYRNYFIFLKIIGERLKDNYRKYGELLPQFHQYMDNPESLKNSDVQIFFKKHSYIMNEIQLDQESFIVFSKIFLDKLGILVEKLIGIKSSNYLNSFTDHKKWFIENDKFNPQYSRLLKDLHWYDQFLDVMRSKIIEHGGKAICPIYKININGEICYRRKRGERLGFLSEKEKTKIHNMIIKYGKINKNIKNIPINPAMMLDEFMKLILENNIKLEHDDLKTLGEVVKNAGGTIDAIILAKHLRKFLDDIAMLFIN